MSTIAAKFSSASTKFQVGVASVAVVAAATLTPAIAEATPTIAPISQASFADIFDYTAPVLNSSAPGDSAKAAAVVTAGPIQNFITVIVQGVATLVYVGLTFVGNVITFTANVVDNAATWVAQTFHVGPYATSP